MRLHAAPPETLSVLLKRAEALSGATLQDIAAHVQWSVPSHLKTHKGWVGDLLEAALGANAGSKALPDFVSLGVELKTVPVDVTGRVQETTFVSTVPLSTLSSETWETSGVYQKLKTVLWVPIQMAETVGARCVQTPVLWSPNAEELRILKEDWEELTDMICLGELDTLDARFGQYLHIRPKAAHAGVRVSACGASEQSHWTLPRGFYLRKTLTQSILAGHLLTDCEELTHAH